MTDAKIVCLVMWYPSWINISGIETVSGTIRETFDAKKQKQQKLETYF